ncbi:MAG TPA: DoxX family protein [Candidatus Deferrimicrobiaceae bacterium]|nr:DoxX family protein [Candidatus Deferrimicrobiaceae bacterium]
MSTTVLNASLRSQISNAPSGAIGPIVLLGRLLFVLIFLMAGPRHFLSATAAYAASQGVPLASIAVPISGVLAIAGALSILLGYRARLGAWLIVLFLLGVTPMMHNFWAVSDPMMHQMQLIMFMKNLSMMGGALIISQLGSGPWSLDSRRK